MILLPDARRKVVRKLQRYLEDIGVVSVILRFWCPNEFGMISPPVEWILSLGPSRYPVENYLNYLTNLNDLRNLYGFDRLADVDMALWSAAHLLSVERDLAERMREDKDFEQMRLANLLRGLGESWHGTVEQQFNLSKSLLEHDRFTAALVASRPFQWAIAEIATKHYGIPKWTRGWSKGQTALAYYLDELAQNLRFPREFSAIIDMSEEIESRRRRDREPIGTVSTRLNILKRIRDSAVHYDEVGREEQLKPAEANEFIANIEKMFTYLS